MDKIAALQAELAQLRRRMDQQPVRRPLVKEPHLMIMIIGGNVLPSGLTGVNYLDSTETELPADYDPDTDPSCADGFGTGYLYINGIPSEHKVLVINDHHSAFGHGLVEGWKFYVASPIRMKVSGVDVYRTVYPGFTL